MEKKYESSSALSQPLLPGANRNTSLVSERLTNSEIESLRQDKKDSLAYGQKAFFPKAKIRKAA